MKKPLIILAGPTAVGKTSAGVELAKQLNAEIISADSMQIYKYMNIGTAKITPEEMQGIPHHLVDELYPDEEFNVMRFQKMALERMGEIYARKRIPIIVGGTGFYIQSVLYNITFEEENKSNVRTELEARAQTTKGVDELYNELKVIDPPAAEKLHPNNVKRVIRALEFNRLTGKLMSEHNETERRKESPYDYIYFVLNDNREILYNHINERVDMMINDGLASEVEALVKMGYDKSLISMQGLGYKEMIQYLEDQITLDDAVYKIKRDTRHFAKRQITWFKREKSAIWIQKDSSSIDKMVGIVKDRYNGKN